MAGQQIDGAGQDSHRVGHAVTSGGGDTAVDRCIGFGQPLQICIERLLDRDDRLGPTMCLGERLVLLDQHLLLRRERHGVLRDCRLALLQSAIESISGSARRLVESGGMVFQRRPQHRIETLDQVLLRGGESLLEATQRRLALWDVPQRDVERLLRTGKIQKTLTLYAPTSGVVTQLGLRSGMRVEPNDNLYTIADLSTVCISDSGP